MRRMSLSSIFWSQKLHGFMPGIPKKTWFKGIGEQRSCFPLFPQALADTMGYEKFESKIRRSSNSYLREYSIYSSLSDIILGGRYISQKKKKNSEAYHTSHVLYYYYCHNPYPNIWRAQIHWEAGKNSTYNLTHLLLSLNLRFSICKKGEKFTTMLTL